VSGEAETLGSGSDAQGDVANQLAEDAGELGTLTRARGGKSDLTAPVDDEVLVAGSGVEAGVLADRQE
jgi:hypothetical protein